MKMEVLMDREDHDHFKTIVSQQVGRQIGLSKKPNEVNSDLSRDPDYSLRKAKQICACYRKDEAHDPEMYVAALAAVLSDYPEYIINYVADPRTGITASCKWLPSVAEVKTACDAEMAKIGRDDERDRRIYKQLADREADEKEIGR